MNELRSEIKAFVEQRRSLCLASVDAAGHPHASVTPFVLLDGCLYIYISGLARHTDNMQSNPIVSVMFVEDESQTKQMFARRRLTYTATVGRVERETDDWHRVMAAFNEQFGEVIGVIRTLPDFVLLRLTPGKGNFVKGFGNAHEVEWIA